MDVDSRPLRQQAAAAVRALIAGEVTWDDVVSRFADTGDPRITEVLEFIECEPEVGGISGVSPLRYRAYRVTLERMIAALERDA